MRDSGDMYSPCGNSIHADRPCLLLAKFGIAELMRFDGVRHQLLFLCHNFGDYLSLSYLVHPWKSRVTAAADR